MRNCKQRPKCLAGSNNGFQTCTRRLQSQAPNQHTPTHHPGRAFFFCFVLFCFVLLVFRLLCAEVVLLSGSERVCLHTSMPFPQKITHMHTTTCLFFTLDRPNNVIVPVLQTERYCHDLLLRKASHSLFHSLTTTLLLL